MGRHLDTALFREARNVSGSVERVRELIAAGADVNRRHKCGSTPLWAASFHGREDMVAALLAAGADAGMYSNEGSSPLYGAVCNGHVAIVELLLVYGADPNATRDSGWSVLASAISHGNAAVVRLLLEAGAAVDSQCFGRSMPEFAERYRQPEIAVMLRRWRRAKPADPFRCVFGKSIRHVAFSPQWRTDTVLSLVRQIHESCDFRALPILADALQDAGCDNNDILTHCRCPGPHLLGCWVVDLVLGKE